MAGRNNFRFEGIEEVQQLLDALPKALGQKTLQGILRKNAKPLIERGRQLAPKDDGDLQKSLGTLSGRGAGKGVSIYVGPRRSNAFKGYHAHLVEFGTAARQTKDGRSTGTMPAQPFWRPAFDQTRDDIITGIRLDIKAILESNFQGLNF